MTRAQETQRRAAEMVAEMRRILAALGKKIRIMEVCGRFSPRASSSSRGPAAPSA